MSENSFSVGRGQIPMFGKGRSPILSKNANVLVRALNALLSITVKRKPDATSDEVVYSDGGVSIVLAGNVEGGSGTGSGRLTTYLVKSKPGGIGDVLICRTWNGTTEGSVDVPVAVNRNSRQLASETINGITYTYADYTDIGDGFNATRTSDDSTTEETQIVTPMWYEDCEIDVISTNYSGVTHEGVDLKLIESSARCWAKVEDE